MLLHAEHQVTTIRTEASIFVITREEINKYNKYNEHTP